MGSRGAHVAARPEGSSTRASRRLPSNPAGRGGRAAMEAPGRTVSSAVQEHLRRLCLHEFPCGIGSWVRTPAGVARGTQGPGVRRGRARGWPGPGRAEGSGLETPEEVCIWAFRERPDQGWVRG